MSMRQQTGFTLFEMMLVIVVIALIAGSIVLGRTVIRNAELQAIIADMNRFKSAAKQFRDKYRYLPGDFPNAASMWGADDGCDVGTIPNLDNASANHARKQATCGGNGNGYIAGYNGGAQWPTADVIGNTSVNREPLRAWQHLANGGFIEGSYTGAPSDTTGGFEAGVNLPRGSMDDRSGFVMFFASTIDKVHFDPGGAQHLDVFPGRYGHVIGYGIANGVPISQGLTGPVLTASDAKYIDGKIDDGRPGSGHVLSFGFRPSCATLTLKDYDASQSDVRCALIFVTGL